MTEQVYPAPLTSFATNVVPDPVYTVPVMAEGQAALEHINEELGLAFDDWDLKYYTNLFKETLGRDPTNVELFDMAQSNSEHRCSLPFVSGKLSCSGAANMREAPAA